VIYSLRVWPISVGLKSCCSSPELKYQAAYLQMLTFRIIRDVRSMFRDVNVREEFFVNMCIILNDYRERERQLFESIDIKKM